MKLLPLVSILNAVIVMVAAVKPMRQRYDMLHQKHELDLFKNVGKNGYDLDLNATHSLSFADLTPETAAKISKMFAISGSLIIPTVIAYGNNQLASNNYLKTAMPMVTATTSVKFINEPTRCNSDASLITAMFLDAVPNTHSQIYDKVRIRLVPVNGSNVGSQACNPHIQNVFGAFGGKIGGTKPFGGVNGKSLVEAIFFEVFSCGGAATSEGIANAWISAALIAKKIAGPVILNFSVSGGGKNLILTAASKKFTDLANTLAVVSAGNYPNNVCIAGVSPYDNLDIVAVAGTTTPGNILAWFSGYGACVSFAAPSEYLGILGQIFNGVSGAAPIVAADLAALWNKNPTLTNKAILHAYKAKTVGHSLQTFPGFGNKPNFIPLATKCLTEISVSLSPTQSPTPHLRHKKTG